MHRFIGQLAKLPLNCPICILNKKLRCESQPGFWSQLCYRVCSGSLSSLLPKPSHKVWSRNPNLYTLMCVFCPSSASPCPLWWIQFSVAINQAPTMAIQSFSVFHNSLCCPARKLTKANKKLLKETIKWLRLRCSIIYCRSMREHL